MKSPRAVEIAEVLRDGEPVGTLTRTSHGSIFEYQGRPGGIAVHLPDSQGPFETRGVNLHPFFAGLLPEGLRLRALVQQVKTSADDLFTLLLAAGADTAGDISVRPAGATRSLAAPAVDIRQLDQISFAEVLQESLSGMGRRAEPVVPGVQEKVSAAMISLPLASRGTRRAYLLKLNPPGKERLVENEHFFMRMAADCGLEAASTRLVHDRDGAPGLLVERFDRQWLPDAKRLRAVHQEDACQFLNRYPADKYRVQCSEIAQGLAVCASPEFEITRFLALTAFSYLIANGDLHAKNVSILADGPAGALRLSPAYDLLTTLPYGDRRMALRFEGRDDNLRRAHFLAFGERFGVPRPAISSLLNEICARAGPWLDRLGELGFDQRRTNQLRTVMSKRRTALS